VQILRGAHFLSHVLWSAWLVWAINVALAAACLLAPSAVRASGQPATDSAGGGRPTFV
jgi:membrane-associated PAP2 superfamily phosphatase